MKSLQQYLVDIANGSGYNTPKRYSGRGMYGSECVSFTGSKSECRQMVGEVIKAANNDVNMAIDCLMESEDPTDYSALLDLRNGLDQVIDNVLEYSEDSMGRNVVIYWEDQQWEDSESEED